MLPILAALLLTQSPDRPKVTPPPETFFRIVAERDRDAARAFYRKYIDVKGLPVVAAGAVADEALRRTHSLVSRLLSGRPDVLEAMAKQSMYLIVIGKDQVYTDMPEYRNNPNPAYMNERVRGTGGRPTSFGEENLLSLPLDRYDDESIGLHEFCHTVDGTLRVIDPAWRTRLSEVFRASTAKGLWKDTYAGGSAGEFWAEICQSYFDCNRVNNWNHGPIGTREQLKTYDPAAYELVRTTFRLSPDQDFRFLPLQTLPNVTKPPLLPSPAGAKEGERIDPYYTKFTWAREFTVVGRGASDEAILRANNTIRKMFAYRHDILKALIADGVKLVVLGKNERLADLPELRKRLSPLPLEGVRSVGGASRTLDATPSAERPAHSGGAEEGVRSVGALNHTGGRRSVDANSDSARTLGATPSAERPAHSSGAEEGVRSSGAQEGGRSVGATSRTLDATSRTLDYSPETKLLVVGEENILAGPGAPLVGGSHLIRLFAKALYRVCAARPVDPNWENRGRSVQQYDLRVKRLDVRFDERLKQLFADAIGKGLWKGTAAVHDRESYWAAGVLAYFDATGQDAAPNDAPHPISTRELLHRYDPALFSLVHETMAYEGKVDWRVGQSAPAHRAGVAPPAAVVE